MHGSTPARLLLNGERAQATSVPLSLSVTSADVFSAEHCLGDAEKPEGREARSSAVFPCRLAGDKCPRRYSLMHINLGLAFPAHLCSMFHRLRKQLVSRHELVPELVYRQLCMDSPPGIFQQFPWTLTWHGMSFQNHHPFSSDDVPLLC